MRDDAVASCFGERYKPKPNRGIGRVFVSLDEVLPLLLDGGARIDMGSVESMLSFSEGIVVVGEYAKVLVGIVNLASFLLENRSKP